MSYRYIILVENYNNYTLTPKNTRKIEFKFLIKTILSKLIDFRDCLKQQYVMRKLQTGVYLGFKYID